MRFGRPVWLIPVSVAGAVAAAGTFIAQTGSPSNEVPFWQYGAIGILAGVAFLAARTFWNRLLEQHKEEVARLESDRERERARGDRLEAALQRQNDLMMEQAIPAMTEFTRASQEMLRR